MSHLPMFFVQRACTTQADRGSLLSCSCTTSITSFFCSVLHALPHQCPSRTYSKLICVARYWAGAWWPQSSMRSTQVRIILGMPAPSTHPTYPAAKFVLRLLGMPNSTLPHLFAFSTPSYDFRFLSLAFVFLWLEDVRIFGHLPPAAACSRAIRSVCF